MTTTRILILAGLTVAASGCGFLQGVAAESLGMPLESKAVAYKSPPQELIAGDGTSCIVSGGRFEDVNVGDHVKCSWSSQPAR